MNQSPLRLCYSGASPDTGNLGVSALYYAVVGGLAKCDPRIDLTVFDEGSRLRRQTAEFVGGRFEYSLCGATWTRRVWQRRSFWNIRVSSLLGGLGNRAVQCLRQADAVLDITGGDSFTDLYGPRRFRAGSAFKRFVLALGKPLILLPQTYGPYRDPRHREMAADICRCTTMAWARDARSFEVLKELLGQDFDPERHRSGVDVAFGLEPCEPRTPLPEPIATWLDPGSVGPPWPTSADGHRHPSRPGEGAAPAEPRSSRDASPHRPEIIGFNVSGLIWHDPVAMRQRYGFRADYREVVLGFLRRVLRDSDARILLVPHVLTPPGHYESDSAANEAVFAALTATHDGTLGRALSAAARARVACVPPVYAHPSEMKWIIARCDWFCGTRMHATIAALSSGVPTGGIAYSLKMQGVFETCGLGGCVVDPRVLDTAAAIDGLVATWNARATAAETLRARVAAVREQAAEPFRALGAGLATSASFPPVGVHP